MSCRMQGDIDGFWLEDCLAKLWNGMDFSVGNVNYEWDLGLGYMLDVLAFF